MKCYQKHVTHTNETFISYPLLLLGLKMKSLSSLSLLIFLLALRSPFFDVSCCFWKLLGLLADGLVDLMGVPRRCIFCFLCFFSCALLALSGDSKPCSIILQIEWSCLANKSLLNLLIASENGNEFHTVDMRYLTQDIQPRWKWRSF